MNTDLLAALARHIMTFVGGYFAARGVGSASAWEAIGAGVVALAGVAWSFWHKSQLPAEARH